MAFLEPGLAQLQVGGTSAANGLPLLLYGKSNGATFWIRGTGTVSAGTMLIEECYYDPAGPVYSGTWSLIATVDLTTLTGGKQTVYHYPGSFWAVRTRISVDVTGGG